jgi:hypothetical protein
MKNSISRLRKGFSMMKFDRYLSSIVKCIKETAFCSLQTIYYEGLLLYYECSSVFRGKSV